jgi:hypothetical protein
MYNLLLEEDQRLTPPVAKRVKQRRVDPLGPTFFAPSKKPGGYSIPPLLCLPTAYQARILIREIPKSFFANAVVRIS